MAALGIAVPANAYRSIGVDALDCDGPLKVFLFALPSLAVYGLGLIAYGLPFRRPRRLVVALPCAILCALLALNVAHEVGEQRTNALAPETCG